jgi:hypothetical protein
MGICTDQSTTYLKRLGYNVIRHPQEDISPLDMIGRQNRTTVWLGPISRLITNPRSLPPIQRDIAAADVNGQRSSTLKLGLGANVLGAVLGAMGGSLGLNTSYTNARTMTFVFHNVLSDRVVPFELGTFLKEADVDAQNLVVGEYVFGNGELFCITDTIKCNQVSVKYERKSGVDAKVDVPAIHGLVGGNVSTAQSADSAATITFSGDKQLIFGFRCFSVGVLDGDLRLTTSPAGAVPLAAGETSAESTIASESIILTETGMGLLDLLPSGEMAGSD